VRVSMPWFRPFAVGLAVLMALACAAPLASADERAATGSVSTSLSTRAAASVAKLKPTPRAFVQAGGTSAAAAASPSGDSRPFFKTPTGVAAVVLMVAGATFVAVMISHDNSKVHSPIR
jgi:hypothetical protein